MSKAKKEKLFSSAAIVMIVSAGVFLFSAYIVLSAFAPIMANGNDGKAHALSKSAVGFAAITTMLRELGAPVILKRNNTSEATDGVIIYTPPSLGAFEDRPPLLINRIYVIVLPKWATAPDPDREGWVRSRGPIRDTNFALPFFVDGFEIGKKQFEIGLRSKTNPIVVTAHGDDGFAALAGDRTKLVGNISALQYIAPSDDIEPVLTAGADEIIIGKLKSHPVFVVAEPDIINTLGFADVRRAHVAFNFIDHLRMDGPVIFDLTLHGIERTRNIVRLALEPPLLGATLSILFSGLLMVLFSASRFGPAHKEAGAHEYGKAALAENSSALIRMAKRETSFGADYAKVVQRSIARAVGAPRQLTGKNLTQFVERLAQAKSKNRSFVKLAKRAAEADNRESQTAACLELDRLKEEITRESQ